MNQKKYSQNDNDTTTFSKSKISCTVATMCMKLYINDREVTSSILIEFEYCLKVSLTCFGRVEDFLIKINRSTVKY